VLKIKGGGIGGHRDDFCSLQARPKSLPGMGKYIKQHPVEEKEEIKAHWLECTDNGPSSPNGDKGKQQKPLRGVKPPVEWSAINFKRARRTSASPGVWKKEAVSLSTLRVG